MYTLHGILKKSENEHSLSGESNAQVHRPRERQNNVLNQLGQATALLCAKHDAQN